MKIKTLVAVLLLSGGVTSVLAQEDCNKNSSISHEAVRASNFKDAYLPWKEVLKDCPTLRYLNFSCYIVYSSLFNFTLPEPTFIECHANAKTQCILVQEFAFRALRSHILC